MTTIFYLFFASTFLGFYYWFYLEFLASKAIIKERLEVIENRQQTLSDEEHLTFVQRMIDPLYDRVFEYLQRVTPSSIRTEYESALNLSGLRSKLTVTNLIILQFLSMLLSIFISIFTIKGDNLFILTLAFGALFFYLPVGLIRLSGKSRQEEMLKALPTFLDLVYVTVEAGLSFDLALKNTLQRVEGPLADEFGQTLEEINHGRNRSEAFHDLGNRAQIDEIRNFITSIMLAEEMGSNIGNVLRVQSESIRKSRKQRAEEAAAKIPVKMTFPLVLLMFPALFMVILGPAVISIMDNLF